MHTDRQTERHIRLSQQSKRILKILPPGTAGKNGAAVRRAFHTASVGLALCPSLLFPLSYETLICCSGCVCRTMRKDRRHTWHNETPPLLPARDHNDESSKETRCNTKMLTCLASHTSQRNASLPTPWLTASLASISMSSFSAKLILRLSMPLAGSTGVHCRSNGHVTRSEHSAKGRYRILTRQGSRKLGFTTFFDAFCETVCAKRVPTMQKPRLLAAARLVIKVIGAHSTLQLRPVGSRGRSGRTGCRRTGSGCGRTRLLWRLGRRFHILYVILGRRGCCSCHVRTQPAATNTRVEEKIR
jgi:hypothetical protein